MAGNGLHHFVLVCVMRWHLAGSRLDALNCWKLECFCILSITCVFLCECVILLKSSVSTCGWLKTSTYGLLLINYFVQFYLYTKICVVWVYIVNLWFYIFRIIWAYPNPNPKLWAPEFVDSIFFQSYYRVTILVTQISQNPNYPTRTNRVTWTSTLRHHGEGLGDMRVFWIFSLVEPHMSG